MSWVQAKVTSGEWNIAGDKTQPQDVWDLLEDVVVASYGWEIVERDVSHISLRPQGAPFTYTMDDNNTPWGSPAGSTWYVVGDESFVIVCTLQTNLSVVASFCMGYLAYGRAATYGPEPLGTQKSLNLVAADGSFMLYHCPTGMQLYADNDNVDGGLWFHAFTDFALPEGLCALGKICLHEIAYRPLNEAPYRVWDILPGIYVPLVTNNKAWVDAHLPGDSDSMRVGTVYGLDMIAVRDREGLLGKQWVLVVPALFKHSTSGLIDTSPIVVGTSTVERYRIAGRVRVGDNPARRRVAVYDRATGRYVGGGMSSPDSGVFEIFFEERCNEVCVVSYDTYRYNAVACDRITPIKETVIWQRG
ncbi:hypothetical protein [Thermodesulforhabdus norvegica]|uniref:Uncharacterized protein n=1 Tax=Thermodesulforhabdus norvegica TaxID=39841 RepID=A0A1I4SVK6_9BACT|nr:hypothetical protein [Thermodesulforhabdus norvegica]SFM68417.1 hypothetical protein SAMN05660836_01186 [Thermodesulforhabdus norvegica]